MNKQSLVEKIATDTSLSKVQSSRAVDSFITILTRALKAGDQVLLSGFGRFDTYERKPRNGRDPQTGKTIKIAGRKVARFVAGVGLKKAVSKRK